MALLGSPKIDNNKTIMYKIIFKEKNILFTNSYLSNIDTTYISDRYTSIDLKYKISLHYDKSK